jgi:glycosyltransferase involved in cell wall biosynthesis
MDSNTRFFNLITPMHNEASIIRRLIDSVRSQSQEPYIWVIVDDDSTDDSRRIVEEETRGMGYARVVHRKTHKKGGWIDYGEVVRSGIEDARRFCSESGTNPLFTAVVDADVSLEPDYLSILVDALLQDESAAIATGLLAEQHGGSSELLPRGAARMYRSSFLSAIGGFPSCPSPDLVAEIKAKNRGLRMIIRSDAKGLHTPKGSGNPRIRNSYNVGMSNRANGMRSLSMLVISALYFVKFGGKCALSYLRGYMSVGVTISNHCDREVADYYRGMWKRALPRLLNRRDCSGQAKATMNSLK